MTILYLSHKNIDKEKWDSCIHRSQNGLIYAEYDYLENMANHWDALVLNDFEAVMPLTWRKKLGIKYLYQPSFFQQGGIFSTIKITPSITNLFIEAAVQKFKFAEITLNYNNPLHPKQKPYVFTQRNNYVLDLKQEYNNIYKKYKPDVKESLRRLKKFNLQYIESYDYLETITLYKKLYQKRLPSFSEKDYDQFQKLCSIYFKQNRIIIRKVIHKESREVLAVALLLKDSKRLYNIVSCILNQGKKMLANYFLYDCIIQEFSGEDMLFDFEGSDNKGIAYFYEKFTQTNQSYPFLKFNLLPAPIRLLKS
ncbi:MAG: hypothetical protein FGM46_05840 [Ferruginibacter sp.]|nr:hypothetical protein [Ferruginibacter sp.]